MKNYLKSFLQEIMIPCQEEEKGLLEQLTIEYDAEFGYIEDD